jgi:hypothetical protein
MWGRVSHCNHKMKKIFFLLCLSLLLSALQAQKGSPLLTHYYESRNIENQNWAICQDQDNIMLFANRKGITAFDGEEWKAVRIPTIAYSMLKNPANGRIYIGGDNSFGYIEKKGSEPYRYVAMSSYSAGIGMITKIVFSDSVIWFYGERSIIRYNTTTSRTDLQLVPKQGTLFTGMIVTPKNTFINVMNEGLYRLESDTLFPIVTGYLTSQTDVLSAI